MIVDPWFSPWVSSCRPYAAEDVSLREGRREHADAVVLAVGDVERVVLVAEDAVGAGEGALEGVTVGAVGFLAGAGNQGDRAGRQVDHSDAVGLGVGEVEALGVGGKGESLGAGKGGGFGGAV